MEVSVVASECVSDILLSMSHALDLHFVCDIGGPLDGTGGRVGPLFHRWLPNGREDAISIGPKGKDGSIQVWFERRGQVGTDGYWRYDASNTQSRVDESSIRRHGYLNAGFLFGHATFHGISDEEVRAVRAGLRGDDHYVRVGKRVVAFIADPVAALVGLLRTRYGQYWLREIEVWDSRRESLGNYCAGLQLKWRELAGDRWRNFRPTDSVVQLTGTISREDAYRQFLEEDDWRGLNEAKELTAEPDVALQLLPGVQRLRQLGHTEAALVQMISALELAVDRFVKNRRAALLKLGKEATQNFGEYGSASYRVAILALAGDLVSSEKLERVMIAIGHRNAIVHQGRRLTSDADGHFDAIVDCIRALLGLSKLKFPSRDLLPTLKFPRDLQKPQAGTP